jgi:hypothetical protein
MMDYTEKKELIVQCAEINSQGNILELLSVIKSDTDQALNILVNNISLKKCRL